jgi:diacylglycerol kinase family enzyme
MQTVGRGKHIAALLNFRARHVTPKVVRTLRNALPDATVLVSEDLDQARRHARRIAEERPEVVLGGGGDGSIVKLINLVREASGGWLPTLGVLRLGTGNAWARVTGANDFAEDVKLLARMPWPLPTQRFDMIDVDGTWCHFAGVGWDARLINDYLRNLDKRSEQLVGSRVATALHKGLGGYLYSLFRYTVPEEAGAALRFGQPRVLVEAIDGDVFTLDSQGRPFPLRDADGKTPRVLYEGPMGVAAAGTEPEWGYGFRAFPMAQAVPGYVNVRIYDRPPLEATRKMFKLWRGEFPEPGMHDFYTKHFRLRFSRPMPFQIAGDGLGQRDTIEMKVAPRTADLVDWTAARASVTTGDASRPGP